MVHWLVSGDIRLVLTILYLGKKYPPAVIMQ